MKVERRGFTAERVARTRPKTYRAIVRSLADPDAKIEHIAKLHRDLSKVARFALIPLRRSARNYFQIRDLCQSREGFLLNTIREICVIWIARFASLFQLRRIAPAVEQVLRRIIP
jgi:hypothetical protein